MVPGQQFPGYPWSKKPVSLALHALGQPGPEGSQLLRTLAELGWTVPLLRSEVFRLQCFLIC